MQKKKKKKKKNVSRPILNNRAVGIHYSIYWIPIQYDTIEDGENLIFYSPNKMG